MPDYITEHFERAGAAWDRHSNPDGYIGLCIAENKRRNRQLGELLATYTPPPVVFGYDAMTGNAVFRERLSSFMARTFLHHAFSPDQIAVLAGAGSVLELLFHVICDAGDAVLVPTPSYAGFWPDLETRDALVIVPVERSGRDGFRLTPAMLDDALARSARPVRALLLTTPDNPLGTVYARDDLEAILDWADRREVHLVVDEIYALTTFGARPFTSIASLRPELGPHVHIVWAFSKDFGASGLRCGVLASENEAVLEGVGALAYWAACSGHTQYLLSELIADHVAVDGYLADMRGDLAQAYATLSAGLDRAGIPYVPAGAAFFLVCDLRQWLDEPSAAGESRLWRRLLDDANVNLTPGAACRITEPGYFRLCYAGVEEAGLEVAIERLVSALGSH